MNFYGFDRTGKLVFGFEVKEEKNERSSHPQRKVVVGKRFLNVRWPVQANKDGRILAGSFDLSNRFPTIVNKGDDGGNNTAIIFDASGLPMCKLEVKIYRENEEVEPEVYLADFGEGVGTKFVTALVTLHEGDEVKVTSSYRGDEYVVAKITWEDGKPVRWQASSQELAKMKTAQSHKTADRTRRRLNWEQKHK